MKVPLRGDCFSGDAKGVTPGGCPAGKRNREIGDVRVSSLIMDQSNLALAKWKI